MKNSIKKAFLIILLGVTYIIVLFQWILKLSPAVAITLSTLKLTDTYQMMWFGEITELSALGTPLWMIVLWVILYLFLILMSKIVNVVDNRMPY